MKNRKQIRWLLTAVCLLTTLFILAFAAHAEIVKSGTCGAEGDGSNLTWTLDDAGTLTISGTGAMRDYYFYNNGERDCSPWRVDDRIKNVIIRNGVTSIGEYAFNGCRMESVTIPNSVMGIGNSAFTNCTGLTRVNITDLKAWCQISFADSKLLEFAHHLYLNGEEVTELVIPDGVTGIGAYAFYQCENLTGVTIPDSVTSIGDSAFSGCTGLTDVAIGNGVTSIGSSAFSGCPGLQKVNIGSLAAWCAISFQYTSNKNGANPLAYAHHLYLNGEEITELVIPDGVTGIGAYAFYQCDGLTSVKIPESVTNIGDYAFYQCKGLTSVSIPEGVTSIGEYAFCKCRGLTSVTIPESVTSIGSCSFNGCSALTTLVVGSGVTSVGRVAFYGCSDQLRVFFTGTRGIDFSGSYISPRCFADCLFEDGVVYNSTKTTVQTVLDRMTEEIRIPDGITDIGNYAFSGFSGLTRVIIPDSVTSIGAYAFSDCAALTDLTGGSGLKTIGIYAFSGCESLTQAPLPAGLTDIGSYAFYLCRGLTDVTIPKNVSVLGEAAFSNCFGLKNLSVLGNLKKIGKYAFDGCNAIERLTVGKLLETFTLSGLTVPKTNLKTVVITDNVKSIAANAFDSYTKITSYSVAQGNGAFVAENGILYSKDKTELVRYPAAKEDALFTIPGTVTAIGPGAFLEQQYLTEIQIPNRIRSLGSGCFARCKNLRTAVCGNGVATLPEEMFMDCPALAEVTIPYGVDTVGAKAFSGCAKLASVTVSNDMGMIGQSAFAGCDGLNDVFFSGTADEWTAIGVKPGNEALTGARKHFGAQLPQTDSHALGDVDGNGKIEAADARLALRAAVGLESYASGSVQFFAADADGSKTIEAADARLILRAAVGLESLS